MQEIKITEKEENQRLDKFLLKYMNSASKGFIYKMLRKKRIKYNGKKAEGSELLKTGDILQMYLAEETVGQMQHQAEIHKLSKTFDIIYEDENILLCGKPIGLLIHADGPEPQDTLIDQVLYYLLQTGQYTPSESKGFTPAACNRLDRNTSGIVVIGKNLMTVQTVHKLLKDHAIDKYYLAIVKGVVKQRGKLEGYHVKNHYSNEVRIIDTQEEDSKKVETRYKPLTNNGKYTLLEVQLLTGRSHQIRAHLMEMGHPIIGDSKYGDPKVNELFKKHSNLRHQFLHAYKICFHSRGTDLEYLHGKEFSAPLPSIFHKIQVELFPSYS